MAPLPISRYDSPSSDFPFNNQPRCAAIMCRNIKTLSNFEPPATQQEIDDAAAQFVRKLSGSLHRSRANQAACEQATEQISASVTQLLQALVSRAEPRNRAIESAKAQARSAKRFARERGQA